MNGGTPIHEEAPGVNLLIARTERGERLVSDAAAAGAIELAPFTIAQLDAMHGDHLPRKLENPARIAALKVAGAPAPRFSDFRRWRMIWRAGLWRSFRAFSDTKRRILAGAHREPLR